MNSTTKDITLNSAREYKRQWVTQLSQVATVTDSGASINRCWVTQSSLIATVTNNDLNIEAIDLRNFFIDQVMYKTIRSYNEELAESFEDMVVYNGNLVGNELTRMDMIQKLTYDQFRPIIIKPNGYRFFDIIDGRHRFVKSVLDNQMYIPCVRASDVVFESEGKSEIRCSSSANNNNKITPFSNSNYNKIIEAKKLLLVDDYNTHGSRYFVLDVYRRSMHRVSKLKFNSSDGIVISYNGEVLIKVYGVSKKQSLELVKMLHQSSWNPEGLVSDVKSFYSGLTFILNCIIKVGSIRDLCISKLDCARTYIDLFDIVNQVINFMDDGFNVFKFVKLLISIVRVLLVGTKMNKDWSPEGIETLTFAAAAGWFPKDVLDIIKRMSLFSNTKILDDSSMFFSMFSLVVDLINKVTKYLPEDFINHPIFNIFYQYTSYGLLIKMQNVLGMWRKDIKVAISATFRQDVLELFDSYKESKALIEWSKRSSSVSAIITDFKIMINSIKAYENTSRIEPVFFVFEGKPGVRKSVCMTQLLQAINRPAYVHVVKPSAEGKDFYDTYNGEDVFYMDDVGAQGVDQWRQFVNFVSPVKLPLNCAEASLKGSKFFSSSILMASTNCFQNISGLTKSDGISEPEALWRRAYVFDFSKVTVSGSIVDGIIVFKHYNMLAKRFIDGFPMDFIDYMFENGLNIPSGMEFEGSSPNKALNWMLNIVTYLEKMKSFQSRDNTLSESDILEIRNLDSFRCESLDIPKHDTSEFIRKLIISDIPEAIENVSMYLMESAFKIKTNVENNWKPIALGALVVAGLVAAKHMFQNSGNTTFKSESVVPTEVGNIIAQHNIKTASLAHPSVKKIQENVFECDLVTISGCVVKCICVLSGRKVIFPNHIVEDDICYLTVYKDRILNHIIIDNIKIEVSIRNPVIDVSVWKLPSKYPTIFPSLVNNLSEVTQRGKYLVHPYGIIDLDDFANVNPNRNIVYKVSQKIGHNVLKPTDTYYPIHYKGMCGALVVSYDGKIVGMHVAGSDGEGIGTAITWDTNFKSTVISDLISDPGFILKAKMSSKILPDTSAIKLDMRSNCHTPKHTNFEPSKLFGVFPITRSPANLSIYGDHTIKDIAKNSLKPISKVSHDEIEFGKKVLNLYIPYFDEISERDIIKGNDILAPINKKSSNGLCSFKEKKDCFDFENGVMTPNFRASYEEFERKLLSGEVDPVDLLWAESLKDELRANEKLAPRSFRVSRVHLQYLAKKTFGDLVGKIMKQRDFNEIMIGVNPFNEWHHIYDKLKDYPVWAGDIGKYDKKMLAQVQQAISEVIVSKCRGNKEFADIIMFGHAYSLVAINDDVYLTTHSMPSGSYLTAMLNSLVNRFYKAMWYYRNVPNAKPGNFKRDVIDLVYGDDTVNALKNDKYVDKLNAITMRNFFESIGMDFTTSTKGQIIKPFEDMTDITFLKRSFRFHNKLNKIVCPLDLKTLYSGLSWYDGNKDQNIVLRDKICSFQREIFLHQDLYVNDLRILREFCEEKNVYYDELTEQYLIDLYDSGEYDTLYNTKYNIFDENIVRDSF